MVESSLSSMYACRRLACQDASPLRTYERSAAEAEQAAKPNYDAFVQAIKEKSDIDRLLRKYAVTSRRRLE